MPEQEENFKEDYSFRTYHSEVSKFLEDLMAKMKWSKNKVFGMVMLLSAKKFAKNPKAFIEELLSLEN